MVDRQLESEKSENDLDRIVVDERDGSRVFYVYVNNIRLVDRGITHSVHLHHRLLCSCDRTHWSRHEACETYTRKEYDSCHYLQRYSAWSI